MKTSRQIRDELAAFLLADLVGPANGPEEVLEDIPQIRYAAGVLFPQQLVTNESASAGGGDGTGESEGPEAPIVGLEAETQSARGTRRADSSADDVPDDDPVSLANSYRPSAMSLSFVVEPDTKALIVTVSAAVYAGERVPIEGREGEMTRWRRRALKIEPQRFDLKSGRPELRRDLEGLSLQLRVRERFDRKLLITTTLLNSGIGSRGGTFYQCGFRVEAALGTKPFVEYRPFFEREGQDEEELELDLLYRNRVSFAVGHGCGATWGDAEARRVAWVATEVLPTVVVPPIEPLEKEMLALNMEFLGGGANATERQIPEALTELCDDYEKWIQSREEASRKLKERFRVAAARNLARCRLALERMRAGVKLLDEDAEAREAFVLANRAMLMQQFHSKLRRKLIDPWTPLPTEGEYRSEWGRRRGHWRAFQMAFILMVLPGLCLPDSRIKVDDEEVPTRDLVDLIWFPTGGGKTEAYLGLAAFLMFFGRLLNQEARGCKVLMRYTLRLLTSQQFQRAASLVSACEVIRRRSGGRLGMSPLTIGLWVGKSLTPNREADALAAIRRLQGADADRRNPFQLLSCPWCGTTLDDSSRLGYQMLANRMIFVCPSKGQEGACPFASITSPLPVCVVDESVYRDPPTIIIGTVDKLAMLAWRDEAARILTEGGGPDLVIQDELHLIAGPLGSIVGLYEGVIEYLCGLGGKPPKIIASTATIRRASKQCRALYDRRMFQFPPQGIDASDSHFAREDCEAPGRVYVGLLPTATSSPLTAQMRSIVALQQGALIAGGEWPAALDPYWTLVQYFGSMKELGKAATLIGSDIPEFLPTMHRRWSVKGDARRWMRTHEELTSRKDEDEIPKILKRLERSYDPELPVADQALDTVLATNMISVGVDVDRLGLMMVVTQPKGTSEYIQASSRVGRSKDRPGLVLTLYNSGRPRDRSHYEHFRSYHESFYRFVEPTSVTPFSPPAMERALHAVLVIAARHVARWVRPAAPNFADERLEGFLGWLRRRVERVDPSRLEDFDLILARRKAEWSAWNPEAWGDFSRGNDARVLMRPAGAARIAIDGEWAVPTSMREVDVECEAKVLPAF